MSLIMANRENILEICEILSEQENLKVTLQESAKGALAVGFFTFLGGMLGGPVGLAVGGTVSSLAVACSSKNYKSVVDILRNDLTTVQKQKLVMSVGRILNSVGPRDVVGLLSLLMSNATLKEEVLKEIGNFFMRELSYKIVS